MSNSDVVRAKLTHPRLPIRTTEPQRRPTSSPTTMPPHVAAAHDDQWSRIKPSDPSLHPKPSATVSYHLGAIVVGAGPSGLATAACLKQHGVPAMILEKAPCVASLWQLNTYDRLRLHLPKQFCELPHHPFPADFPTYPTRLQFIAYLLAYTNKFHLRPRFGHSVVDAAFHPRSGLWRVLARKGSNSDGNPNASEGGDSRERLREFRARWLVVASGENAEPVGRLSEGREEFLGEVFHSSGYRNGTGFVGKRVLVVGCGNTGMEIALDLANYGAVPSIVVRSPTHILPREILGKSTFLVAMALMRNLPLWVTDKLLVAYTSLTLGDSASIGIPRPSDGPMLLKEKTGKTPILDVGTFAAIKSGRIKVRPAVECLTPTGAQFEDGRCEDFDAVILATGYRSNVPKWLKDDSKFFSEEGLPRLPFPHGWKGDSGLYVAGLGRKGLLGAAKDAQRIAVDIAAEIISDISSLRLVPCQQHPQLIKLLGN